MRVEQIKKRRTSEDVGSIKGHVRSNWMIENIASQTLVNCNINGKNNVGGILGYLSSNSQILNSFNSCSSISAESRCGGVVGMSYGTIERCTNEVDITAGVSSTVGGIVGHLETAGRIIE